MSWEALTADSLHHVKPNRNTCFRPRTHTHTHAAVNARFAAQDPHSPTLDGNRGKVHLRVWRGEKMPHSANYLFFFILKEKKNRKICIGFVFGC